MSKSCVIINNKYYSYFRNALVSLMLDIVKFNIKLRELILPV